MLNKLLPLLAFSILLLVPVGSQNAFAIPTFVGPTPYLSTADIPLGFYAGGSPVFLEDFEDGTLDGGLAASTGAVMVPSASTDSVDADDGAIDGSGTGGHSWSSASGPTGITFTFPVPVAAAGIVWTDGSGLTTFEAFGPGMTSLGTIGPVGIAVAAEGVTTPEDHFFGVQDPNGIIAVKLSNVFAGIEVDHVQYGEATSQVIGGKIIPIESTSLVLAGAQTNAVWIMSALAVIGSVAFGALYITSRKS